MDTITLTFGNAAENHKGMEIIGEDIKQGLSYDDLKTAEEYFKKIGIKTELIDLKDEKLIKSDRILFNSPAYILIARNCVGKLLSEKNLVYTTDDLYDEQKRLKPDTKALMYGRVVNKKARHNLCFSDFEQKADIENGKGTVIKFSSLPFLEKMRARLNEIIPISSTKKLQCEGNYYYDIKKCYIGMHGDTERKIVIAVRLGADFPLYYQWYHRNKPIGEIIKFNLSHGDMYFMSDKAVGHDWKKSSLYTLRHAAGFNI